MPFLSATDIQQKPAGLAGWRLTAEGIQKQYELDDFGAAMYLVNRVADLAEEANHHPKICIAYNKVTFTLTTHDAGGITEKDFSLAAYIEAIVP
jgi:4a-hydroxytetrahydrobiopterin dehydratase